MAESGNVPELGGYDYEFTSKVPEYWECLVCHLTLKDPVQIEKCGHRLCRICMESLFRRPSPTCPADRQPLSREKIFSDNACHRQILDLTVKCSPAGCSWTGELRAVEKHQSECLFKEVKCSNSGCAMMLSKRDMKTHETSECSWRKVNCEYCQESVIMNQKQKHYDICRRFPVLCTNKCGVRDIPREELEVHGRDECPATEVQCEYKNLGCEAVFPRSDAESHSQTQIESHLNLALRGLAVTQHQLHELVTVVKNQSQQIERQSQQIERQSQQIERLISKDKAQSKQKEKMISKDKKQSEQGERSMSTVQSHPLQRERLGPIVSTPFEWKILNIVVGLIQRSLLSEPFYLFERGYKYVLKIEMPHGVLMMPSPVRAFLNVYIKVVPGEFDELLSWPCKEKVRVTFVDQNPCQDNRENISHVIDFSKDELPRCRSLHDHHDYRFIFGLKRSQYQSYVFRNGTTLIRVNRE